MEKSRELEQIDCLNCGASIKGAFCHHCGQHVRDNLDRSLSRLLSKFLGNIFFFDNRFFLSVKYLFLFPGRMTVEFLAGKRKKFISPITLFLFINLIYFFVNPLSDYSLSLYDQYSQPYSMWSQGWIDHKLKEEGTDWQSYSITYQNMSDKISKSILIINVPMIAILVYLMAFKKRRYYFDSLIFAFHFFSLFLFSWIMLDWVGSLIHFLYSYDNSMLYTITSSLFVMVFPLLYAILYIKKFMAIRWYWAIPAGVGVMISVLLSNMFYRFIILLLTLLAT